MCKNRHFHKLENEFSDSCYQCLPYICQVLCYSKTFSDTLAGSLVKMFLEIEGSLTVTGTTFLNCSHVGLPKGES